MWRHLVAKFGTNANGASLKTEFALFLAGEITQVLESIPWVRCASGNVFFTEKNIVALAKQVAMG